jgi:hypothetical protein
LSRDGQAGAWGVILTQCCGLKGRRRRLGIGRRRGQLRGFGPPSLGRALDAAAVSYPMGRLAEGG